MNILKLALPVSVLLLSACASTPYEPLAIVPYNDADSMALNIAKQTDLLSDYEFGLRTHESPLRDFTKEDIKNINTAMEKKSGGGASKFLGVANILTGNFTGAISLAGGFAADLSHSDHYSASPRWIVTENAEKYPNELTARKTVFKKITSSAIEVYEDYGFEVNKRESEDGRFVEYIITYDGMEYRGGLLYEKEQLTDDDDYYKNLLKKQTVSFNGVKTESYTLGLSYFPSKWLVTGISLSPFIGVKGKIKDFTFDSFMAKVTKKLGENYFYYQPNFSKFTTLEGKKFTMLNDIVPKIYTNGERHDFIKPE